MLALCCLSGCRIYSFTGVSLSEKVKTFSIDGFYSTAAESPYDFNDKLTEALRVRLNGLGLEEVKDGGMGDLHYRGTVVAYEVATPTHGRPSVTASVHIHFSNEHDDEMAFDNIVKETLTLKQDATKAEDSDNEKLQEELLKKIFDYTVANWR